MSHSWPLLDIAQALADADLALSDIVYYVEQLQQESEGHFPPEAATLLANVAAARAQLTHMLPAAITEEIAKDRTEYDRMESEYSD